METKLRDLVEQVHSLGKSHTLPSGVVGSSNSQNILLEVYRLAAELVSVGRDKPKLEAAINDLRGKLMVAEATNTIGSKDLEEVMSKLDEIEGEL